MKKMLFSLFVSILLLNTDISNASASEKRNSYKSPTEYLFVMHSKNGYIKGDKLFLNNVNPNTLYFSDKPHRIVGHMDTKKFLSTWNDGNNSLDQNHPNIVMSFKYANKDKYIDITLEVSNPIISGKDLIFRIDNILENNIQIDSNKKIKFKYPNLFIDGNGCWVFGC